MIISESLQQIYFLGVHPDAQSKVAEHMLNDSPGEESEKGGWHIFARLSRPGLIAMRSVRRTTGLDLFLLAPEMEKVEDVAEIMGFGLENEDAKTSPGRFSTDPEQPFHATWKDFERKLAPSHPTGCPEVEACLFLTFLRLNWDVLTDRELWRGYGYPDERPQPSRTEILKALSAVLNHEVNHHPLRQHRQPLHFHIAGGTGDCDVIITGLVNDREALDSFLLVLAQLGTDCLAAKLLHLGPAQVRAIDRWHPICAASTTELAVPWCLYEEILDVTRLSTAPEWSDEETALQKRIDRYLKGGLRSAVFLRRSRSFLASVRHDVTAVTPPHWKQQAVLGDADMLLRRDIRPPDPSSQSPPKDRDKDGFQADENAFSHLLLLLGRLDGRCHDGKPDFPRRIAAVLSFDDPVTAFSLRRPEFLAVASENDPKPCPTPPVLADAEALQICRRFLENMLHSRRREEYRILERMVERAVTLQRQGDLSRELRTMARLTLQRLSRALQRMDQDDTSGAMTPDEQARWKEQIVVSGMHLERTLSHHARGSVPLLLSTIAQARSTDHFGSETMLTSALGAPASSVARRLLQCLKNRVPDEMLKTLKDMAAPILYASHDPDFSLVLALGMIRVPRWVIWYPTASSYVLHEVGHAVFHMSRIHAQAAWMVRCIRRHWPDPATPEEHPDGDRPPAAYRWVKGLIEDYLKEMRTRSRTDVKPLEDWGGQLDEITAELFCHRYSYPQDGSTRHVYDVLEHLSPLSHRLSRPHRLLFISRELSVRIAQRLIEASENTPLHEMSEETLLTLIHEQTGVFSRSLTRWLNRAPAPFKDRGQHLSLIRDVRDIWKELSKGPRPGEEGFDESYETPTGKAIQWGIFVACLARSEQLPQPPVAPDSVRLTQHLWAAILETSKDADKASPEEQERELHIIADLEAGRIPATVSQWPERLPRRLHDAIRRRDGSVLLPQRIALTLALADWVIVHDRSAEEDAR